MAQRVKNLSAMWETQVQSPSQEDPLEKGMAIYPVFCLDNPMDRKPMDSSRLHIVHGVAKSWTCV